MDDGSSQSASDEITPTQRIAELNDIDTSVSTLLSSASNAISVLSNQNRPSSSPELSQAAFSNAASTYFSTLSSIEVRLRRQVYALEEAGLIQAGDERDAKRGRTLNNEEGLRRGGGGPLDPSWLNARATNKVEQGMKRELLEHAKEFLDKVKQERQEDKTDTKMDSSEEND